MYYISQGDDDDDQPLLNETVLRRDEQGNVIRQVDMRQTDKVREVRRHKPKPWYKCNDCDYHGDRSAMRIHTRNQSVERPYSCSICNYAAKRKKQLITHFRRHTDLNTSDVIDTASDT